MAWMLAMKARNMILIGEAIGEHAMRMPDGAVLNVSDVKHFIVNNRDNACGHYWAQRKCVFPGYVNALVQLANMERKIAGTANFVKGKSPATTWGEGRVWYRQGRDAKGRGEAMDNCPYPLELAPDARSSWLAGWHGITAATAAPTLGASRKTIPPAGNDIVRPSGWTAAQEPVGRAIQDDGRGAFLLGLAYEACPYVDGTAEAACWQSGYEEMEAAAGMSPAINIPGKM